MLILRLPSSEVLCVICWEDFENFCRNVISLISPLMTGNSSELLGSRLVKIQ